MACSQSPSRPAAELGDLVRNASNHKGPWPKLSVWHGSADRTVNPANADEIVKQWLDLHRSAFGADVGRHRRRLSAPDLVERGRRDRRRILHHHRHGPWHPARHRRRRRAIRRPGRVPDRGGNFLVLSHCEFLRPDPMDWRVQDGCKEAIGEDGFENNSRGGREEFPEAPAPVPMPDLTKVLWPLTTLNRPCRAAAKAAAPCDRCRQRHHARAHRRRAYEVAP